MQKESIGYGDQQDVSYSHQQQSHSYYEQGVEMQTYSFEEHSEVDTGEKSPKIVQFSTVPQANTYSFNTSISSEQKQSLQMSTVKTETSDFTFDDLRNIPFFPDSPHEKIMRSPPFQLQPIAYRSPLVKTTSIERKESIEISPPTSPIHSPYVTDSGFSSWPKPMKMTRAQYMRTVSIRSSGMFSSKMPFLVFIHSMMSENSHCFLYFFSDTGAYEHNMTLCPPPLTMIIFSFIEIIIFLVDSIYF